MQETVVLDDVITFNTRRYVYDPCNKNKNKKLGILRNRKKFSRL